MRGDAPGDLLLWTAPFDAIANLPEKGARLVR